MPHDVSITIVLLHQSQYSAAVQEKIVGSFSVIDPHNASVTLVLLHQCQHNESINGLNIIKGRFLWEHHRTNIEDTTSSY